MLPCSLLRPIQGAVYDISAAFKHGWLYPPPQSAIYEAHRGYDLVSSLPAKDSKRCYTEGILVVPSMSSATDHSRSFACVGSAAWNCFRQFLGLELKAIALLQI